MTDPAPGAQRFAATAVAAYRSEAIGAELFPRIAELFPEHVDELRAAERIERAMMDLLLGILDARAIPVEPSVFREARAEADRYIARVAGSTWTGLVDDILVWSAQALHEFSSLLPDIGADVTQRAAIRTFLAHEAQFVVWARHAALGEGEVALARLHDFLAAAAL